MRDKFTMTERVVYLLNQKPEMSPKQIAEMVGCTLPHVYRVRKKYEADKVIAAIKATGEIMEGGETGQSYSGSTEWTAGPCAESDRSYRKRVLVFVIVVLSLFAIFVAI